MIRVLHSVSNMDRAGLETMIMNYYRHIDRSRIQFDFLANKPKKGEYEPEITALGGHIYRAPGYNPLKFGEYTAFLRDILAREPDIKIIHVHNGELGLYALEAAKLCGMKARFYHAHSTRIAGSGKAIKTALKPFIKYAATDYLACGEEAARFYYGGAAEKHGFTLVRNAIDTARFTYSPAIRERVRREHSLGDAPVIGHVGSFSEVKNHLRLISVFAELRGSLPECKLVLAGEGPLIGAVMSKAEELGVRESVVFTGSIPNVNELYQAMDAFALPSLFEGLPVVGVEAQAAGLPCLFSSAVPSEADFSGLVRFMPLERSDSEWAGALTSMLSKRNERRDMSDKVKAAGYDITSAAVKLEKLYIAAASR